MVALRRSFQWRLYAPFAAALALLIATFALLIGNAERRSMQRSATRDISAARDLLGSRLTLEKDVLEAVAHTLSLNDALVAAHQRRDTLGLLGLLLPRFASLRLNHGLTHLYLLDTAGRVVVRAHRPEERGDVVDRWSFREAVRTGEVASAVEIGRLRGLMTLRVVLPLRVGADVVAYFELGKELDGLIDTLARTLDVDAFVFVRKDRLDRAAWEQGMAMFGRAADWDRFADYVVTVRTSDAPLDDAVLQLVAADGWRDTPVRLGGARRFGGSVPIRGPAGDVIGRLVVLQDHEVALAHARRAVLTAIILCVLLGAATFATLVIIVRRRFARPLAHLRDVARRAGAGDLAVDVQVMGDDELADLGRSLRQMIDDLRLARDAWERRLVEAASDAVIMLDADGVIVGWNTKATQVFLRAEADAIARPMRGTIFPTAEAERIAAIITQFDADHPETSQARLLDGPACRSDGSRFDAAYSVVPIRTGSAWRFGVFLRDVTEERRATRALVESEARFRLLVENASVIPWQALPGTGDVTYVGNQARELLGHDLARWRESPFASALVHAEDRAEYLAFLKRVLENGEGDAEYRMVRADNSVVRVRDVVRLGFSEGDANVLYGFRFDVSERTRLEEQLRSSQKMEAVGRLAGGIAHDYNNLLTAVFGFASMLEESLPPDSEQQAAVAGIMTAASRAADLTQQLLGYARQQVIRPVSVDLQQLLNGLHGLIRQLLREDVVLVDEVPAGLWPVHADPGRLEQVIVNLVVNARDAMPHGGRLVLSAEPLALDAESAAACGLAPGDFVRVRVTDTGIGMAPEVLARAFEPFFTTKAVGEGTGLGLATSLGIIQQAGGTLTVESAPGRGTTFFITLPRAPDDVSAAQRKAGQDATGGTEAVLVVDDDEAVAVVVSRILVGAGYHVHVAADGVSAERIAADPAVAIDLLLSDLVMPGRGGVAIAQQIGRVRPDIRVLFMTGYASHVSAVMDGMAHADVITKPFRASELLLRVRRALDQRRVADARAPS
ncbi:MAG: hypothetical protein C0497_03285 [Gemmatimonas sp.]|nr:hypothetical protein [Gemmatimonas sp.]